MFCYVAQRRYSDFAERVESAAVKKRMPYMGAIELTYRCNLSCCHCYCNLRVNDQRIQQELSTKEVNKVIDEAADAGCLWLLMTGGEVLLRKDFKEIYLHAVKKGMFVEVFTNATLIDEETAKLFSEFPPVGIDVSIYGSDPFTHDGITRVSGSFEKMMEGLGLLKKHNVKFSLKTILMTLNHQDLENIRRLSREIGAEYRFDTIICPRLDGGEEPCAYRLSAEEMSRLDIEKDFEACDWIFKNFWNKKCDEPLSCGAGVFSFNINPYGVLSPCTMFSSFQYPLKGATFIEAWGNLIKEYGDRFRNFVPAECRACSMIYICSHCPAAAEIETKDPGRVVKYLCEYARKLEKMYFIKKEEIEHAKKSI